MSWRRDSHKDYLQELQLMGVIEVQFYDVVTRQYTPDLQNIKDVTVTWAKLSNGLSLGYFTKSHEGFWRFTTVGSVLFDDVALRKIARKLVELNANRQQVEKVHES